MTGGVMNRLNNRQHQDSTHFFNINYGDYSIFCGFTPQQCIEAYKLRSETYCNELRWVKKNKTGLEKDRVDGKAIDIGVFKGDELVAYLRCLPPTSLWMINKEFIQISDKKKATIQSPNSCEATRLLVKKTYRRHQFANGNTPADALYQGLFAFCQLNHYRFVYMTVSSFVLRTLINRGLPCTATSEERVMDDGVITVNGVLDWEKFVEKQSINTGLRKMLYINTLQQAALNTNQKISA